jgi:hypothetical protein
MEHGVLGVSRTIHGLCTCHASGYRTSNGAPMPIERYAICPKPLVMAALRAASGLF